MPDWRDRILKELTPGTGCLTLAADPDGLLLEAALHETLRGRGFEVVTFEDSVAFRFDYESRFRSRLDRREDSCPEVVVRIASRDLSTFPYDLLQTGRPISFGLTDLFPNLSYPIVAALDRSEIDALHRAQERYKAGQLGVDATKDFVLRHVFDLAPELVKNPSDLLRVLLRRHYRRQRLPRLFDDRMAQLLRQSGPFAAWPLETILPSRDAFFAFLQERWPLFLDRLAGTQTTVSLQDVEKKLGFEIGGPAELPFDHDDIRVYIDNLFVEGMLRPVAHDADDALRDEWAAVGIRVDPGADRLRRLRSLTETVGDTIPGAKANHGDWFAFAWRWAELHLVLLQTVVGAQMEIDGRIADFRTEVDRTFLAWLDRRYAGLHNQPPTSPVMVHHLPRYLARRFTDDSWRKVALVVVDGIAIDQWLVLRDVLATQRPDLRFHEDAAFAWVPTITSISRQAIFAGAPPLHFPGSILTTDKEEALWNRFWTNQGLAAKEIRYVKGLGNGSLDEVRDLLSQPGVRSLGLVVDKVDKIMHGMTLGAAGMHNQIRQWTGGGFMAGLLDLLFDSGFTVFLTSDHGNVEAEGLGRPSEGAIADVRGERVRLYPDPTLRSRVKERFPDAVEWPALGLPEDCVALLAPGRSAFVRRGERIVGHGGVSLEEVIVPVVEIERAAA